MTDKDKDKDPPYSEAFDFIVTKARQYEKDFRDDSMGRRRSRNQAVKDWEKRRKNWPKTCEQMRLQEKPMERNIRKIKHLKPLFEYTFEEYEELIVENDRLGDERSEAYWERQKKLYPGKIKNLALPEGMTKTRWEKLQRRERQQIRLEDRQVQADYEYKRKMSPIYKIEHELKPMHIECDCSAESIRQGEFCPVCKLVALTHKYMVELFEEAAIDSDK